MLTASLCADWLKTKEPHNANLVRAVTDDALWTKPAQTWVVKCNVFLIGVHSRLGFVAAFASWTDAVMQVTEEGEADSQLGAIK